MEVVDDFTNLLGFGGSGDFGGLPEIRTVVFVADFGNQGVLFKFPHEEDIEFVGLFLMLPISSAFEVGHELVGLIWRRGGSDGFGEVASMGLQIFFEGFGGQLLAALADLWLEGKFMGEGGPGGEPGERGVAISDFSPELDDFGDGQCLVSELGVLLQEAGAFEVDLVELREMGKHFDALVDVEVVGVEEDAEEGEQGVGLNFRTDLVLAEHQPQLAQEVLHFETRFVFWDLAQLAHDVLKLHEING